MGYIFLGGWDAFFSFMGSGRKEGKKEGRKAGRKEGRKETEKQGRKEGRKEGNCTSKALLHIEAKRSDLTLGLPRTVDFKPAMNRGRPHKGGCYGPPARRGIT